MKPSTTPGWIKTVCAAALMGSMAFAVTGCASDSANVYSRDQVKRAATAQAGIVESVRNVQIKDSTGIGGVAGGVIGAVGGSSIGGGNGSIVTGVIGAVAGGLAGNALEKGATAKDALEITVKLDTGQRLVIVQGADTQIVPQQRVDVLNDGQTTRVVPRNQ